MSTFTFSSAPGASTTKKGKRKTGRCLIPDQVSEAENQLFKKWLQSETKKNGAITEEAWLGLCEGDKASSCGPILRIHKRLIPKETLISQL